MYKRQQISRLFYLNTLRLCFALVVFILNTDYCAQEQVDHQSDSIAVITTHDRQEIRGVLTAEDNYSITIETGNELRTFYKDNIYNIRYITREQIFDTKEFENPNPNYTRYCFMPSSFISEKGEFNTISHYFITANSKVGLHENIEISAGNFLLFNLFSSLTYSKNITNTFVGRRSITAAGSIMGNYLIDINNSSTNFFNGWGGNARITLGNKNRNSTIGVIGYNINGLGGIFYGGYFGSQIKFSERFTLAGESVGLTMDNVQFVFLNSVILNWIRNRFEDWSLGVIYAGNNIQNNMINLQNNTLIVPYLGFQRKF